MITRELRRKKRRMGWEAGVWQTKLRGAMAIARYEGDTNKMKL